MCGGEARSAPFLRVNEPKTTGARSEQTNSAAITPLLNYILYVRTECTLCYVSVSIAVLEQALVWKIMVIP